MRMVLYLNGSSIACFLSSKTAFQVICSFLSCALIEQFFDHKTKTAVSSFDEINQTGRHNTSPQSVYKGLYNSYTLQSAQYLSQSYNWMKIHC